MLYHVGVKTTATNIKYVAGYNMAGFLPESDPVEFDSFDDAKDYLASELDLHADYMDTDDRDHADNIVDAVRDWIAPNEIDVRDGNIVYEYWIVSKGGE